MKGYQREFLTISGLATLLGILLPSLSLAQFNRVQFNFEVPIKHSIGYHSYQYVPVGNDIHLVFPEENPYYSYVSGLEAGIQYPMGKHWMAGLQGGINATFYEEYYYEVYEFRNLIMLPLFAKVNYRTTLLRKLNYLGEITTGYQFKNQNFYNKENHLIIFRESGGIFAGVYTGVCSSISGYNLELKGGYEWHQNNVKIYLDNLPLSWVGTNTGNVRFRQFNQNIVLRLLIYLK